MLPPRQTPENAPEGLQISRFAMFPSRPPELGIMRPGASGKCSPPPDAGKCSRRPPDVTFCDVSEQAPRARNYRPGRLRKVLSGAHFGALWRLWISFWSFSGASGISQFGIQQGMPRQSCVEGTRHDYSTSLFLKVYP